MIARSTASMADPCQSTSVWRPPIGQSSCQYDCATMASVQCARIASSGTPSPSAVATGLYAVSFGVLAVAAGCSVAQACVLSVVTFTGASQLTFVSVIAAGGGDGGRACRRPSCWPGATALYVLLA